MQSQHSMLLLRGTPVGIQLRRPPVVLPPRGTVWAVAYRRNPDALRRTTAPIPPNHPPAHASAQPPPQSPPQPSQRPPQPGIAASGGMLAGLVLLLGAVYLGRDQIHEFVDFFIAMVESYGAYGYVAYAVVYFLLELLAVPAIPLTMTAGAIFGIVPGTAIVSMSATAAAAASFLIARYVAHDKVQAIAQQHPRWAAIDRAIGQDSFRVVTLLRLSPLLPLAVSNYLYGLTSVELLPYVLGSWLGMLPGTCAYVAAGAYGADALAGSDGAFGGIPGWQVLLAIGATVGAVTYIGLLAKQALADIEQPHDSP